MTDKVEVGPDISQRAVRGLSKLLFGGAKYRLEIGAAIAGRPLVNTAELAAELDIVRQTVNQELQLLEQAGLLLRTEQKSERRVYLLRQESRYWAWCKEAHAEASVMLGRVPKF